MRSVTGQGAAIAAIVIHLLAAQVAAAQQPGNPEVGRDSAMGICARCHLVREDQSQPAMDSAPSFDALARDPAMSEARLRGFLNRPHPPMPDPQLSRAEIDNVVRYILELRRRAS